MLAPRNGFSGFEGRDVHRKILTNALGILLAAVIMAAPEDEPVGQEKQLQTQLASAPTAERRGMHEAATAP